MYYHLFQGLFLEWDPIWNKRRRDGGISSESERNIFDLSVRPAHCFSSGGRGGPKAGGTSTRIWWRAGGIDGDAEPALQLFQSMTGRPSCSNLSGGRSLSKPKAPNTTLRDQRSPEPAARVLGIARVEGLAVGLQERRLTSGSTPTWRLNELGGGGHPAIHPSINLSQILKAGDGSVGSGQVRAGVVDKKDRCPVAHKPCSRRSEGLVSGSHSGEHRRWGARRRRRRR